MSPSWTVERLEARVGGFHLGPVDLSVAPGEAVAVLGPSGAGKTTLLRALAGFLPLRGGRILRDRLDISDWLPEERRLGYVPQGLGLFPHLTVERNVGYPLEILGRGDARARTEALLDRFRLRALARRRPATLSGGEAQRVALARALAADPDLLVWDEPWQGLDVQARHELGLLLHELRTLARVPLVLVAHDPALAFSVADAFVVIRGGRATAPCDAGALMRSPTDAFSARFVGFENVFEPSDLADGRAGGLRAWLRERAGPEGVAFLAPRPIPAEDGGGGWTASVRSARPDPYGVTLSATADELLLTLRVPPPVSPPLPGPGERIGFRIDPAALRALGGPTDRAGAS